MKTDNLVSIIVPVYNTQNYLSNCINSILNQSYKNIEVILINDGSTDQSAEICDKYATLDSRVKVIHQKNSGVSNARNTGIKKSNGSYISFVDSDDTIDKDFIDVLYNGFNESIDMTVCDFKITDNNHDLEFEKNIYEPTQKKVLSRKEAVETVLYGKLFAGHSCNKMFRKTLLNKIEFQEGIYVYEDMLFVIEYLLKSNAVLYIKKPLYRYYIRDNSASHGTMSDKKTTAFAALNVIEEKIKKEFGNQFLPLINYNRIKWIMYCYTLLAYDKPNRKKHGGILKENLKIHKSNSYLTKKMKIKIFMLSVNTKIYYLSVKICANIRNFFAK